MFRRLTSRRTLKWTGTIACALVGGLLVTGAYWQVTLNYAFGYTGYQLWLGPGQLFCDWWDMSPNQSHVYDDVPSWGAWRRGNTWPELGLPYSLVPETQGPPLKRIGLPLPTILAAMLATTILLWRLDHRRPLPGHCKKCNYNLTGNMSGRCPECGSEIVEAPPQSPQATRRGERAVGANEPPGGNATGV